MKTKKIDPMKVYVCNLLIVEDGIATISKERHIVVKKGFIHKRMIDFKTKEEVLPGNYIINQDSNEYKQIICAYQLHEKIGYQKIEEDILENYYQNIESLDNMPSYPWRVAKK